MILKKIFPCEHVYPTTYVKMLLGRNNINTCLKMFHGMKNLGADTSIDFINSYKSGENMPVLTKKNTFLSNVLSSDNFVFVDNWFQANGLDELESEIAGPILSGREILFFHKTEKLLLLFTYFPLHMIQVKAPLDDIVMRELKTYVYDNFPQEVFEGFLEKVVPESVDAEKALSEKSMTTRYSKNPDELIKVVNVLGNHQWSIIRKDNHGNHFSNNQ